MRVIGDAGVGDGALHRGRREDPTERFAEPGRMARISASQRATVASSDGYDALKTRHSRRSRFWRSSRPPRVGPSARQATPRSATDSSAARERLHVSPPGSRETDHGDATDERSPSAPWTRSTNAPGWSPSGSNTKATRSYRADGERRIAFQAQPRAGIPARSGAEQSLADLDQRRDVVGSFNEDEALAHARRSCASSSRT